MLSGSFLYHVLYLASFIHFISLELRRHFDILESSSRSARDLANVASRAAEEADRYADAFNAPFRRLLHHLMDTNLIDNFTPTNILHVFFGRDPSPQELATIDPLLLTLISNLANQLMA